MFKYFRVSDNTLDALSSRNVYASHFGVFNDPFECWCVREQSAPPFSNEDPRFMEVSHAFGFPGGTPREYYEMLLEALEGSEPSIQAELDAARIACFASRPDNLLMWAHYADGLRGFCIEFEEQAFSLDGRPLELLEVAYMVKPPIFDSFLWAVAWDQAGYHSQALDELRATGKDDGFNKDYQKSLEEADALLKELYINMFATKPKDWLYEEEVRLIVGAGTDAPLHVPIAYLAGAVRSITIGHRASQEHVQRIRSAARIAGVDAPIRFARRDEGAYTMRFEDIQA